MTDNEEVNYMYEYIFRKIVLLVVINQSSFGKK